MNEMSIPTTFSIEFVGELEKINDLISKVGIRVYHRYGNRNGTWITDDFAEKLNQTIFHVPIVGTYNSEIDDFEDHQDHGNKKAYGFVPTNASLNWVLAEDGKEYLETEAYLWVGYWPEAEKIIGKSQSMELDKKTIAGDWKVINGDYYFVYQAGAFKGLCTLGDAVLPCFEKAAFFNLDEDSRLFFQTINEMNEKNSGGEEMDNEQNTDVVASENEVVPVEENENTGQENFTEQETSTDTVQETEEIPVENTEPPTDSSAEDQENANSGTVVDTADSISITARHSEIIQNEDGSVTIVDEENSQWIRIETYYSLQEENKQLNEKITTLENENASLSEYKDVVMKQQKISVIDSFKKKLSEEEISPFVESLDQYSTEELKTKLAVVLAEKVLGQDDVEVEKPTQFVSVPSKQQDVGVVSILRKNKRN